MSRGFEYIPFPNGPDVNKVKFRRTPKEYLTEAETIYISDMAAAKERSKTHPGERLDLFKAAFNKLQEARSREREL